jgi:transposase
VTPPGDDDPALLRARLAAADGAQAHAEARAARAEQEVVQLKSALAASEVARLELQQRLDALLRGLYRPKAEKIDPEELERAFVAEFGADDPATDAAAAAQAAEAADDEETPATKRERRKHPGRRKLPEHLERVVVDERPPAEECCGKPMRDAGVEVVEQLDFVKAHYRVRRNVRHKLACAVRDHRVVRPGPPHDHPLERCGATVALLAKVVVEKYDRHVPLNRQAEEAARQDVPLSKATQCGWLDRPRDAPEYRRGRPCQLRRHRHHGARSDGAGRI